MFGDRWALDPAVRFLNHGSFGACPREVLAIQDALRARLERQPVQFMRDFPGLHEETQARVAAFLGASPEDVVPVPNATTGVNTVLRSLVLRAGDELLLTDHGYRACRNAAEAVAAASGARVVLARVPFPLGGPDEVLSAVRAAVTPRTRLVLIDQVTSPTGLVFPIDALVAELQGRGIDVLVDAAHAPGMLALDLDRTGAAFTTGNFHKWVCSPKGSAFLHVRRDRQAVRPLVISHGASAPLRGRSRFQREFEWTGTADPTAWLAVPAALDCLEAMLPGGWEAVRRTNHERVVAARRTLCEGLGIAPPCPEAMLGSLAALPLPPAATDEEPPEPHPFQMELLRRHGIEVPVYAWPRPPARMFRVSAQLYNQPEEYAALARALVSELAKERAI